MFALTMFEVESSVMFANLQSTVTRAVCGLSKVCVGVDWIDVHFTLTYVANEAYTPDYLSR